MAEIYANNISGKLAEPVLPTDTTFTLEPGHNFPDPGSNWYRATLYRWEFTPEGVREFDHEVVKVTALAGDVLTVERELEGPAQSFDPGTPIQLRLTAGTVVAIEARGSQALADHSDQSDPHSQYEQKTALKAAAYRNVVGGSADSDLMARGAYGLGTAGYYMLTDYDAPPQRNGFYDGNGGNSVGNIPPNANFWPGIDLTRSSSDRRARLMIGTTGLYLRGWTGTQQDMDLSFYHNKNVVGSVSQSGGVPTGALFESDDNSFGRYIKFPDGLLIYENNLRVSAAPGNTSSVAWGISNNFLGNPNYFVTPRVSAPADLFFGMGLNGILYFYNGRSSTLEVDVYVLAIGRWY